MLEFLANNDLYLRTPYTGTEPNADPRRWELASRVLDSSGNDFALLGPIVGREPAEAFVKFFKAQRELSALGRYSDAELARFSVARKYQLAQQCLNLAPAKPDEARALVERLGEVPERSFPQKTGSPDARERKGPGRNLLPAKPRSVPPERSHDPERF